MYSNNNKRIVKNTLFLYLRMILVMLITLYTTRIVLEVLGVEDFGIYNVVGGIITLLSFLSGTMASASQRYFAFELGKSDFHQLRKTSSMILFIYIILSVLILIIAETVGLWFLYNKMNIPSDRIEAAYWIYQFSVLTFLITILTIPYNAMIIAYEDMKIYAYVSIVEVVLKLSVVFVLSALDFDKLKLYSVLIFLVTLTISSIYREFCQRKYFKISLKIEWDYKLFKEIVSYSGWNLFGSISNVVMGQGLNILLNMFFNPAINAARGIAYQVSMAIRDLANNFYMAVRPQVTKYYAQSDSESLNNLVNQSAKFSFFLILLVAVPLLMYTEVILGLWLKIVPLYTVLFTQLLIINVLVESVSNPLRTLVQATGKVKLYQSVVGGLQILNLPISLIFLKLGFPPETVFVILIIMAVICLVARLVILKKINNFNILDYISKVIFPSLTVSILSLLAVRLSAYIPGDGFLKHLAILTVCFIVVCMFTYFVGMNKRERNFINSIIKKIKL